MKLGGYKRTKEIKEKLSQSLKDYYQTHYNSFKGRTHTEETKRKISQANKEYYKTHCNAMKNKKHSKITREKMRKFRIDFYKNHPEVRKIISEANKRREYTKEIRENMSRGQKERYKNSPNERKKMSDAQIKRYKNLNERRKDSEIQKEYYKKHPERIKKMRKSAKNLWQNPVFINKILKSRNAKPNKSEIKLINLLNEIQPNEWAYNGDFSQGITIGGKIPDFVNVNGKKAVIELFGEYWHSPLRNPNITEDRNYENTLNHYKKYGFDCLIIWHNELENLDNTKEKIDRLIKR